MKTCRICGETKPLDQFHRQTVAADGRQSRCIPCALAASRQWSADNKGRKAARERARRAENPEKAREQQRASRERNRHRVLAGKRADYYRNRERYLAASRTAYLRRKADRSQWTHDLKKLYGITLDDFDRMVKRQLGRCAICDEQSQRLEVDHCHTAGHVRALLCQPCNNGLGCFRDDPERLRSALRYLRKHAA